MMMANNPFNKAGYFFGGGGGDISLKDSHDITHTIHVWYIYLHMVDVYGKCR